MRADKFFAEKFGSRTKAAEALERGWIAKDGKPLRPKDEIESEDGIKISVPEEKDVSNGGYKLARALKVISLENINARYLTKENFSDTIEGVTADVSFISLRLILPVVKSVLAPNGVAFVLVKPQFECEKRNVGKGGIVRAAEHPSVVKRVLSYCGDNALYPFGIVNAPVRKGKNLEYVLYLKNTPVGRNSDSEILQKIQILLKQYARGTLA